MASPRNDELGTERLRHNHRVVQRVLLACLVASGLAAGLVWREERPAGARELLLLSAGCCFVGVWATDRQLRVYDHGLAVHYGLGLIQKRFRWADLTEWAHADLENDIGYAPYLWLRFRGKTTLRLDASDHHLFQWLLRELDTYHADREVAAERLSRRARLWAWLG